MRMKFLLALLSFIILGGSVFSSVSSAQIEVMPEDEILLIGERMYREGILPSGEPMQAYVMGDIPVDGRMFTCDDCHQRSGLGSLEGTVITWPTNGRELYKPRRRTGAWHPPEDEIGKKDARKNLPPYWQIADARPAYTDATLARLILTGIDSGGRQLHPIMPVYELEDRDLAILIHYLKNLSSKFSPGVDEKTIHFATVITDDVPAEDRAAMLSVLQAHIDVHNSQNRHQERRAASGPFYKTEMHQSYRRMQLSIWELHGPESTWSEQLQDYYRQEPVFAILGGISTGSWQPVHDFCEQHTIPCIFPLTDFPVISESDWYTLYFSKGFYQEGETVARYLHTDANIDHDAKITVLYRESATSATLNRGFAAQWLKLGGSEPEYIDVGRETELTQGFWQQLLDKNAPTVLILWLDPEDLGNISVLAGMAKKPAMIFLSAGQLGYSFGTIPEILRDTVYLTYPYSLPGAQERSRTAVRRWLQARKIPETNMNIQAKIYFLGWMLAGAVKNMRSEFFREYFLEGFDMMIDQDYAIAVYPRLTFGPGQRYASKGCYIVQLSMGEKPTLLQKSDWVIH